MSFILDTAETAQGLVHLVHTKHVNWIIVEDASGITLIDGGYPGQAEIVEKSLHAVGSGGNSVCGALITHAHVDHIGGLRILQRRYGFPVFSDLLEVPHARREFLDQASPVQIAKTAYRPATLRWLADIIPMGALSRAGIGETQPISGEIDLPGRPILVAAHGHTCGHAAYLVGDVLISGDALVTGHTLSKTRGPQLLPDMFSHDPARVRTSVAAFGDLDARVLFPGHGPAWRGRVADAARVSC